MRDLRAIIAWFSDEVRAIGVFAREPRLWAALACGLLLWTLAYQTTYVYQLDIGGDRLTQRRHDDDPFLTGFNKSEPGNLDEHPDAVTFRWASEDAAIALPGIGGGQWSLAIKAATGRSAGQTIASRWSDGTTETGVTVQGSQPLIYRSIAYTDSNGDLTIHFATPPLNPPNDPRSLGLVIYQVRVVSIGGVRLPAMRQLVLLAAALALAYALLRRLALAPRSAQAVALGLAALAAGLVLRERMALTLFTPRLPAILAGAYLLGVALDIICRTILVPPLTTDNRPPVSDQTVLALPDPAASSFVAFTPTRRPTPAGTHAWERHSSFVIRHSSFVVGLIVLALVLRLGGMLHPHAIFSDVGLNTNNLIGVAGGEIYFTEGLPSEAGSGRAPYPPGQYIALAPALLIFPTERTSLGAILKIGNALWDSLAVGVLWYVLRRSGYGPRAALLGAALYVLPPPILKSLSVGELANVFGQGLTLPLLALLAIRARQLHSPRTLAAVMVLLGLALLGHLGVMISLFCLLGYLALVWLIRLETRRAVQVLVFAGLLVGALIALFYYTPFWEVLRARVSVAPPPESAGGIIEKLGGQIAGMPVYGIHPLLMTIGAIGVVLVALRPRHWHHPGPRPALGSLLIAWWGGTLLSLGLLLFANQGVRWQPFLYPALCLGAGPTLAGLWQRGRAGRLVAVTLLGFLIWYGLAFWVAHIRDYLH